MKKTILMLALFMTVVASAQSFEGKITYSNAYKSKNAQISDQQWSAMLGSVQEYQIKGANYRSDVNGTMAQWVLFVNKDNKLYSKLSSSETVFYNDVTIQDDEVIKSELNKNTLTILGYKCDELVLTCKNGIQKYYFHSGIPVDPKAYVNHKFGNFYDFVSKAKALPLKTIIETPFFTIESVATAVKPMKLDDASFQLPAGTKTEKSPY